MKDSRLIQWNPHGFGFIQPPDGCKDLFCHCSAVTYGNVLRDGDTVEYQAEFDDHKGNYRSIEVTGGRSKDASGIVRNAGHDKRGNILGMPPPILDRIDAATRRKAVVTAVVTLLTAVVKTILGVPPPILFLIDAAASTKNVRRGC